MAARLFYSDPLTNEWVCTFDGTRVKPPAQPDLFVVGLTKPQCANPLQPTSADNVGWDGNITGGTFGDPEQPKALDYVVPAGETRRNMIIWANVILGAGARLINCITYGAAYATNRLGLIIVSNGAYLERVTIWGTPKSVNYYTNGIRCTGGTVTTRRCVFMRVVDHVRCTSNSSALWIDYGSYGDRFAAFDNDADHPTAGPGWPAGWTHNDLFQASVVCTGQHEMHGTRMESFFDTTGVTWSGGSWGVGTASGGEIGMPSTMLNAGYFSELGRGTWANGVTLSGGSGHKLWMDWCWINGVNATSGMVQFTVSNSTTPNQLRVNNVRVALGGKPSGSGKFYIFTYGSSTIAQIGTGDQACVYEDQSPSVPVNLWGKTVIFTATGASVVP